MWQTFQTTEIARTNLAKDLRKSNSLHFFVPWEQRANLVHGVYVGFEQYNCLGNECCVATQRTEFSNQLTGNRGVAWAVGLARAAALFMQQPHNLCAEEKEHLFWVCAWGWWWRGAAERSHEEAVCWGLLEGKPRKDIPGTPHKQELWSPLLSTVSNSQGPTLAKGSMQEPGRVVQFLLWPTK